MIFGVRKDANWRFGQPRNSRRFRRRRWRVSLFTFFFFSSFLTTLEMVSPSLTSLSHTLAGGIYYSFPFSLFFWEAVVPREE